MALSTRAHSPAHIVSRIAAATLGAYALVFGFVALATLAGRAAGMAFEEASGLTTMLGFVLLLAAFCWAFAAASLARVWLVLAGGGAAMALTAWLLTRAVVA